MDLIGRLTQLLAEIDRDASDDQIRQCLSLFAGWSYHATDRLGGGMKCPLCGESNPHIHWLEAKDKA